MCQNKVLGFIIREILIEKFMKNNASIFVILAALFSVFAIVSVLVYFTNGKNKKLLKRKLAIGASIIALTGVVNGCKPVVSCYYVAVEPLVICTDSINNSGEIVIKNTDTTIRFDCTYVYYQNVSFRLTKDNVLVISDSCGFVPQSDQSKLTIEFAGVLAVGAYNLSLFYYSADEIPENALPFYEFKLKVVE